jgi:hypothetical protein
MYGNVKDMRDKKILEKIRKRKNPRKTRGKSTSLGSVQRNGYKKSAKPLLGLAIFSNPPTIPLSL